MYLFKKIFAPSGAQMELAAFENWTVRWHSRYGQYAGDTREEVEVFLNEEDANTFADSLRAAYKLLRHTSGTNVTVKKS
jgi:hypothetical protein